MLFFLSKLPKTTWAQAVYKTKDILCLTRPVLVAGATDKRQAHRSSIGTLQGQSLDFRLLAAHLGALHAARVRLGVCAPARHVADANLLILKTSYTAAAILRA